MKLEEIVMPLLHWYEQEKRDLPWRKDQEPYHVWISEIMLQQTRVEAVKEYYIRFMKELPTVYDLAQVEEDKLLKLWEGLGYYNRARNLQKAANVVVKKYGGNMPANYEDLQELVGIGAYTAGAIASICYGEKAPAVDGNVLRLISRVLNSFENIDLPKTKKNITKQLQELLPEEVGTFNQALMEIGAMICLPTGMPKCEACPIQNKCQAYQEKTQIELPKRNEKRKRRIEEKTILLLVNYNKVAIHKRASKGLLANLYEFPNFEGLLEKEEVVKIISSKKMEAVRIFDVGKAKHIFTHIEWHMQGYLIAVTEQVEEYKWVSYLNLKEEYSMPSAFSYYERLFKRKSNSFDRVKSK